MHPVDRPHAGRHDGMSRFERRVGPLDRLQLVEHGEEAAVVRRAPVAPGTLALLDDRVDAAAGTCGVGDGDQLRPAERLRRRLRFRRTDEQLLLTEFGGEVVDAGLDRAVEMADGVELLTPRDDVGRGP